LAIFSHSKGFLRIESDDTILLVDERGGLGWIVKMENVDWEAYEGEKGKELSQQNENSSFDESFQRN
jgi:hypothetical protein